MSLKVSNPAAVVTHATQSPASSGSSLASAISRSAAGKTSALGSWLGWKKLEGRVIHIDAVYLARPDFNWGVFLFKLSLFIVAVLVIGPIIIGIVLGVVLVSLILSAIFPRGVANRPGCLSSLATQVFGFFLSSKLRSPQADVPVRDARLRDAQGQEHLVRIKGEITSGNINAGDEVEVEGPNRNGTLVVRRGWNKRTRSEIRVRWL